MKKQLKEPLAQRLFARYGESRLSRLGIFLTIALSQIGLFTALVWFLFVERGVTEKYIQPVSIMLAVCMALSVVCDFYLVYALREIEKRAVWDIEAQLVRQAELTEEERIQAPQALRLQEDSFHALIDERLEEALRFYEKGGQDAAEEILEALGRSLSEFKGTDYCENSLVNTLLNNKAASALDYEIQVDFTVQVKEFPCNSVELCSLFSNVLDNAIEGCCALPEGTQRRISLRATAFGGSLLLVSCENTAGEGVRRKQGRVVSSKRDGTAHGWGLEILKDLAEKYEGELTTDFTGGIFTLRLSLQYPEKEAAL